MNDNEKTKAELLVELAELRANKEKYKLLFDNANDAIFIIDGNARILAANSMALERYGYTYEELLSMTVEQLDSPADGDYISERIEKLMRQGHHTFETVHRCKDGSLIPVSVSARRIAWDGVPAVISICRDITELKQAEEVLRRRADESAVLYEIAADISGQNELSELLKTVIARVATLLEVSGGGMYIYDEEFDELRVFASTHTAVPIGATLQMGEGLAGRVAQSLQPIIVDTYNTWEYRARQYDRIPFAAVVEAPMLYRGKLIGVLVAYEIDDDTHRFTQDDARLLSLLASGVAGVIQNAREVAERKLVEDALRESEERFRTMFAMHGAIMLLIEPDSGQIIDANLSAQNFYGYSLEELKNMTIQEINILPIEEVAIHRQEAVEKKRNYFVFPHRLASGNIRTVEVRSSCISIEGNEFLFSIIHDITERKRMEEHEREQRALAEALSDSAATLNSTLDFDKVLGRIMDGVGQVVPHDIVTLFLLDRESQIAKVVGCRDCGDHLVGIIDQPFPISETRNLREMLRTGGPVIIADTTLYEDWVPSPLDASLRSNLGVPIKVKGETLGFLSLYSTTPDAFTPLDAERLHAFVNHAAVAIENARLYAEVQKLAVTDTLTGLFNRSFFNAELTRLESSRDYPVSVIVADLDNMKITNDTLGHAAGDELLRQTAKIFQAVFRAADIITRIGGDEFAILLPKTDAKTAEHMLLRIQETVTEYNTKSLELPIRLSLGTSTAEKDNLAKAFTVADQRMYADKATRKGLVK